MSAADDFDGLIAAAVPAQKPPPGWEPGHILDHESGVATFTGLSLTDSIDPDEAKILAEMKLDPEQWAVIPGTLQVRKWQQKAGSDDWCWYYRITVERRSKAAHGLDEFVAHVRSRKPRKRATRTGVASGAQIWATSDWQIGKAGTIETVLEDLAALPDRFEAAWVEAGKPDEIGVVFAGDLGENCTGHYPGMLFQVELHERDQRRIVREVAFRIIDRAAGLATKVTVITVGGNHGENRTGGSKGEMMTSPGDNKDVAAIEDVRWAARDHDRWAHVEWLIPGDDLTVTAEIGATRIAVNHGTKFGGQGVKAVEKWWNGQAGNHRPAGAATLLITGHYHHLSHVWIGPRTWVQCPAEDAGSLWFAESTGIGDRRAGSVAISVDAGSVGAVRLV
jgi:hypothetical protein